MTTAAPPAIRGSEYAELGRQIKYAGLLRRRPLAYLTRISLTLAGYLAAWLVVGALGNTWWQLVAAIPLAIAFTQVAFLGHDGGHQQIFAGRRANDLFGRAIGSLLVGLSFGWWVGKHNRHHAHPNREEHDPDIGDEVFAFTTNQVAARTGRFGQAIIARQAWLFFPILTLEGFHLHVASFRSLLPGSQRSTRGGNRAVELSMLLVHLGLYLGILFTIMSPVKAVVFVVLHQALFGLYMGCSFAPNHKGMRVIEADEEVDYLRRQVLTSRNVQGSRFVDNLLGGLNYQIEHHLFPSMPRSALRHAAPLVREYCQQQQIPYCETTLFGSYAAAVGYLHELGAPYRR